MANDQILNQLGVGDITSFVRGAFSPQDHLHVEMYLRVNENQVQANTVNKCHPIIIPKT